MKIIESRNNTESSEKVNRLTKKKLSAYYMADAVQL